MSAQGLSGCRLDPAFYEQLWDVVSAWRTMGEVPLDRLPSRETCEEIHRLLFLEARLLDQNRLDEWLALYTDDCIYWIPADVEHRDPRITVSWELNDRRRLEERVERLATGRAYAQLPPTRTVHHLSNIEVITAGADEVHALCNFLIQTHRSGKIGARAGWCGYVLRRVDARWKIVLKRINLFDADLPQANNAFTL
ncbi:MAG: aromatic-ring-hydroxylating dioxygenase subunit beta [Panacagrimonas sp.]